MQLQGKNFDVAIIGGGINGAATANLLSSEGYDVLLVDAGDFGSGSSSRSSRIMHCGLNYLAAALDAPGLPAKLDNLVLARAMMRERARLLATMPARIRPRTFYIPILADDATKPWQYDCAFHTLKLLAGWDSTLLYRRYRRGELGAVGISRYFGPDLVGLVSFQEYVFDWPERICVDFALAAAATGATIRNYTSLVSARCESDLWRLSLRDTLRGDAETEVTARLVANLSGPSADKVNAACGLAGRRTVTPNKGCHIAVRLPAEFRDVGIISRNELNHLFLCVPWKDFHILGPTETVVEPRVGEVTAERDDVEFILDQANSLMPSLGLGEDDVLFRWAGLRPATFEAGNPRGAWRRTIHDLTAEAGAPLVSMSWGRLADHAFTASDFLERARRHLGTRERRAGRDEVSWHSTGPDTDPARIVSEEQPAIIEDILFRRTGSGWSADLGISQAPRAADALASSQDSTVGTPDLDAYEASLRREFSWKGR